MDGSLTWLSKNMSYWKAHITIHDVLASELSYSLIFNNIHPDKLGEALSTVGLGVLPNRFFLVQVDDYQNHASKLRVTQEFFQKPTLVNVLRDCMRAMGIQGFAANAVGQDSMICYLCCDELGFGEIDEYLLGVAERFKQEVRAKSAYTISICISQRCSRLSNYSRMYPRMSLALGKTYFTGKEVTILLEHISDEESAEGAGPTLGDYYPELLAALSQHRGEHFERLLQRMMTTLLQSRSSPQRTRLEIIWLIQRLGEYCVQRGVPEKKMAAHNEQVMSRVLACNFIVDTGACLREYYEKAARALEEHSRDREYVFKLPVSEYIAEHYAQTLRLGDLAKILGFSEGHFARVFSKQFGKTFVQYLTEYRIEQSKKLLSETNLPIEQIAYRVGINSYSYFCTCFKRTCGTSPGSYRNHVAKGTAGEATSTTACSNS